MSVQQFFGKPLGYEQVAVVAAAGLTVPAGARVALITTEDQNVRWRDDGVSPTAAVGQIMKPTDDPLLYDGDLAAIEFIQESATALVNVCYYG